MMTDLHAGNEDKEPTELGCWTCRVRRKKCDRSKPVCRVCSTLLITCYFDTQKPDWIDSGKKQHDMVEHLKQEVKARAPQRRSLSYAKYIDNSAPETVMQFSADLPLNDRSKPSDSGPLNAEPVLEGLQSSPDVPRIPIQEDDQRSAANGMILDGGFMACFLDFYFPFLFPFYRPSILDRGRAWVIDFIMHSRLMEQTSQSLSSYLFLFSLETEVYRSETCRQTAWLRLLDQMHQTFTLLQEELRRLAIEDVSEARLRTMPIMGCILMLQRFETTVWSFKNCHAHLDAATELFEQILPSVGGIFDQGRWASDFDAYLPSWSKNLKLVRATSSEQMAFRFFSALLLVDDIVASTALEEEPKLYPYHASILGDGQWQEEGSGGSLLQIDRILGCQNWVMIAIANVSVLNVWRRKRTAAGDLDMIELVQRATAIRDIITANLLRAERASSTRTIEEDTSDIFVAWTRQTSDIRAHGLLVTRVWAHAAMIYLSTVISGWQPANSDVRYHVARILELLTRDKISPAGLRIMAWPFCVAGCLADESEESAFRGVTNTLHPPGLHGPMWKALELMDSVWQKRSTLSSDTWDIASCFRQPGHLILLL